MRLPSSGTEGENLGFSHFGKLLTEQVRAHMREVFDRRKQAAMADAAVKPVKIKDAKA